jgi:hypothetical protein
MAKITFHGKVSKRYPDIWKQKAFFVHINYLRENSRYFETFPIDKGYDGICRIEYKPDMKCYFIEFHDPELYFQCPHMFGSIVHWLYTGEILPSGTDAEPSDGAMSDLLELAMLAKDLGFYGLYNASVNAILKMNHEDKILPSIDTLIDAWSGSGKLAELALNLPIWGQDIEQLGAFLTAPVDPDHSLYLQRVAVEAITAYKVDKAVMLVPQRYYEKGSHDRN